MLLMVPQLLLLQYYIFFYCSFSISLSYPQIRTSIFLHSFFFFFKEYCTIIPHNEKLLSVRINYSSLAFNQKAQITQLSPHSKNSQLNDSYDFTVLENSVKLCYILVCTYVMHSPVFRIKIVIKDRRMKKRVGGKIKKEY